MFADGESLYRELERAYGKISVPVAVAGNAIKHLANAAGDKTTVQTTGDNNAFESSKTHINNEVVTKSFAEGASPTVTATPAATTASPVTSHTVHEAAELPKVEEPKSETPEAEVPVETETPTTEAAE